MNCQASNVIGVPFERRDSFVGVVVENTDLEVVGARHEPILARYESHATNGYFCDLECLDQCARFKLIDVNRAIVETGENPGLGRVEVDTFDAI